MVTRKNGNRRLGTGSTGRRPSSSESGGINLPTAVDINRVMREACRDFARIADWRQVPNIASRNAEQGQGGSKTGFRLSEDHEGLHSGRYIDVSVLPAANALSVKGGYHDGYWQPRIVCQESMPLKEVTAQVLGCLLTEIHNRLCSVDQAQSR